MRGVRDFLAERNRLASRLQGCVGVPELEQCAANATRMIEMDGSSSPARSKLVRASSSWPSATWV